MKRKAVLRKKTPGNPALAELGKPYQFQPGQSGNPGGRPRSLVATISEELRRLLRSECSEDPQRRTWAEVIAEKLCRMALEGNVQAINEIGDRTEGRPSMAVTLGGGLSLTMSDEERAQKMVELTQRIQSRLRENGAPEVQIRAFELVKDTFLKPSTNPAA